MTEHGHSLYELGWDDGYEAVKQNRLREDAPHPDEEPDYQRGFRDGMKAAREEAQEAADGDTCGEP